MIIVDASQMQMLPIVFIVSTWFIFFTYEEMHMIDCSYMSVLCSTSLKFVECNTVLPQNFPTYFRSSSLDMYKLHKATLMPFF